ncbi:MAG: hypothetical protein VYD19_06240 [Myxococcota bacterium]|nr:hypothetical protein [Myxococcota bacterium]
MGSAPTTGEAPAAATSTSSAGDGDVPSDSSANQLSPDEDPLLGPAVSSDRTEIEEYMPAGTSEETGAGIAAFTDPSLVSLFNALSENPQDDTLQLLFIEEAARLAALPAAAAALKRLPLNEAERSRLSARLLEVAARSLHSDDEVSNGLGAARMLLLLSALTGLALFLWLMSNVLTRYQRLTGALW